MPTEYLHADHWVVLAAIGWDIRSKCSPWPLLHNTLGLLIWIEPAQGGAMSSGEMLSSVTTHITW